MDLKELLQQVAQGRLAVGEARKQLENLPYEDIGFAKLDHHRRIRKGFGEVIFGPGKTAEQMAATFRHFADTGANVLATRVNADQAEAVMQIFPAAVYCAISRTLMLKLNPTELSGKVAVCSGGTGDMSVAEEAAKVAEFFGAKVVRHFDVGVAGIHRLFAKLEDIRSANAIAAVAGMEGALGSVVAGLVDVPVIAVPTSVGYGASFGGVSALLTMLNSCAEGLATVNIDNGFGAGYLLAQINRLAEGRNAR